MDEVFGDLIVGEDGLSFSEKGGIDFQPITVLVPGGEEFPFTFSSKNLQATAEGSALTTSTDFNGTYRTPSYRTSNFIDPKGRQPEKLLCCQSIEIREVGRRGALHSGMASHDASRPADA